MPTESRKAINRRHYLKNCERYKAEKLAYYHENYKDRIDPAARSAYHKRWRADNPEKARGTTEQRKRKQDRLGLLYKIDPVYRAKIQAKNRKPSKRRFMTTKIRNLKKKYNLSHEDYEKMVIAQDGKCAICGVAEGYQFPHVDHCHATKKVRGLLCHKCNRGLGLFNDDVERLRRAADYIVRSRIS